ncbi:MAG: stage II sporulation protein M, partial [Gammaproteobacteria bacterium]|nr:stage II sporulation protein M [Gammaproteobacteria bacterium]
NRSASGRRRAVSCRGTNDKALEFVTRDFPAEVRRQWRLLLFASCAYLIPAVAVAALILEDNKYVHSVLSPQQVENIEDMYDPNGWTRSESEGVRSRIGMFGYYIYNNASIGLRCVASGLFFGIGTIVVLAFNGLNHSAVLTHLLIIGYGETLLSFIAGHSALELTAIAISGAAGLRLGQALLAPGAVSRSSAIRRARRTAVVLAFGAMIMFFVAAFVEAFWSATQLPSTLKYGVGIGLWLFVVFYFVLAGRHGIRQSSD